MMYKFTESKLGHISKVSKSPGQIIVTPDSQEIYFDTSTGDRIAIGKDVFMINTIKALINIMAPVPDKLYFVKEDGRFYWFDYSKFSWIAASSPSYEKYTPSLLGGWTTEPTCPFTIRRSNNICYIHGSLVVPNDITVPSALCKLNDSIIPKAGPIFIYIPEGKIIVSLTEIGIFLTPDIKDIAGEVLYVNGTYPCD